MRASNPATSKTWERRARQVLARELHFLAGKTDGIIVCRHVRDAGILRTRVFLDLSKLEIAIPQPPQRVEPPLRCQRRPGGINRRTGSTWAGHHILTPAATGTWPRRW